MTILPVIARRFGRADVAIHLPSADVNLHDGLLHFVRNDERVLHIACVAHAALVRCLTKAV